MLSTNNFAFVLAFVYYRMFFGVRGKMLANPFLRRRVDVNTIVVLVRLGPLYYGNSFQDPSFMI